VMPPMGSEIDEVLAAYTGASAEELRAFTVETGRSKQFQAEVVAALHMIADGGCLTETMWAGMIVMLWAGMAIERKRHEVALLDRIYESGPV